MLAPASQNVIVLSIAELAQLNGLAVRQYESVYCVYTDDGWIELYVLPLNGIAARTINSSVKSGSQIAATGAPRQVHLFIRTRTRTHSHTPTHTHSFSIEHPQANGSPADNGFVPVVVVAALNCNSQHAALLHPHVCTADARVCVFSYRLLSTTKYEWITSRTTISTSTWTASRYI